MMASTLNNRIYKNRISKGTTKKGEFILNEFEYDKKGVKLYLFIKNKELRFNVGLSHQFLICLNLLLNLPSKTLCNRFIAKENFKPKMKYLKLETSLLRKECLNTFAFSKTVF